MPLRARARAIFEKDPAANAPYLLWLANGESGDNYDDGNYDAAAEAPARTVAIGDALYHGDHPKRARAFYLTGMIALQRGELVAARSALETSRAMRERIHGPIHGDVMASMVGLAKLERRAGHLREALVLATGALTIGDKALGPENFQLLEGLEILARLHEDAGDLLAARTTFERALALVETSLHSTDREEAGDALVGLAEIHARNGDRAAAIALYERALGVLDHTAVASELGRRRSDAELGFATLLWADPKQRARARVLAQDAEKSYRAAGNNGSVGATAAMRWLRTHRDGLCPDAGRTTDTGGTRDRR